MYKRVILVLVLAFLVLSFIVYAKRKQNAKIPGPAPEKAVLRPAAPQKSAPTPIEKKAPVPRREVSVSAAARPVSETLRRWQKKPEFRLQQLYRYDMRNKGSDLYITRVSAAFDYLEASARILLRIMPFYEARRNLNDNIWERKEFGVEFGRDIFPWFYLGEAIQGVRLKDGDHGNYHKRRTTESETRLLFSHNLVSIKSVKLKGYVLGEYTYDFDEGKGMRNEIAVGLIAPIGKYIETDINWRHIDRIHDWDADTLEASLTLVF